MPTLTAVYLNDGLGRVEITITGLQANVVYSLQRNTAFEPTWVDVRGGQDIEGTTVIVYDYEYTPNMVNNYRLIAPAFHDSFNRIFPTGGALNVTGNSGSRADTPDAADLDITGDIDIRAVIRLPDYSTGANQTIVSKYNTTGNQRSYGLRVSSTGALQLLFSLTGATGLSFSSTQTLYDMGINDNDTVAIRVTRVAATGTFAAYIGSEDTIAPSSWIPVGTTLVGTVGNLFAGTAVLELGSHSAGTTELATGLIVMAQVRNGIMGAIVATPDFTAETPGTLSFADATGKTWTMRGDSSIVEYGPIAGTSWGTADTGQVWQTGATSAGVNIYVNNGWGVVADPTPNGDNANLLVATDASAVDAEVTFSGNQPAASLDSPVEYNAGLRGTDFNNYYEGQLVFNNNGNAQIAIAKRQAGVYTLLTAIVNVGVWTQGVPWMVRFRVEAQSLSIRAWEQGEQEPTSWQLAVTDTTFATGSNMHIRARKSGGAAYEQWFGPITVNAIPDAAVASDSVTPTQADVFLKSVQYPSLNKTLECVNWDALSRTSRVGLYDIKGRHEILAITDVGSSASFNLTFTTRSKAENRSVVALLTYGGVLLLQPPGDDDSIPCQSEGYSGTPAGFVVPGNSVQAHALPGQAIWTWTVGFTQVVQPDPETITPTTITWQQLWDIIGPEGTWEDVWATWPTWQALWSEVGSSESFFQN